MKQDFYIEAFHFNKNFGGNHQMLYSHIWINKMHNYRKNVPVFVPVFFYAVTMLIFQTKRIISSRTLYW